MNTKTRLIILLFATFGFCAPCVASESIANEVADLSAREQEPLASSDATESLPIKRSSRVAGIEPSGFSPEKAAFKAVGGLLLMLGFLFLVAYLAKRKGLMQNNHRRQLHLRETLSLGAKEKLAVVEFAGESMVVGITAHNIRLIRAVKKCESDEYESNPELGAKTAFDFQAKLNDFLLKGSR